MDPINTIPSTEKTSIMETNPQDKSNPSILLEDYEDMNINRGTTFGASLAAEQEL
jgi:hypothetical protein